MALTHEQRIERIVTVHQLDLKDAFEVSDRRVGEGDFEQSIRALGMGARNLGSHASVFLRHPRLADELREARELIASSATRMVSSFDAWLRRGAVEHNRVHAGEFGALMVALLAIGDVSAAERIARMVGHPAVRDNIAAPFEADIDDVSARLLAATILADRTAFERQFARWPTVTAGLFLYKDHWPYPQLMKAILVDDAQGFNAELDEADRLFRAKFADRRMKHDVSTGDDPSLSVDLQSVGLANLARARGLQVAYSSETIPVPPRAQPPVGRRSVLAWFQDHLRRRTAAVQPTEPSKAASSAPPQSRPSLGTRAADQLRFAMDEIESVRLVNPTNLTRGKFDLAARNAGHAVERYLERIAVLLRIGAEPNRVAAEVTAAAAYLDQVDEAARRCGEREPGPSNFIHLMVFLWPMVLLMVAGHWERLEAMARTARLPFVHEEGHEDESGGVDDIITKMLLTLVLDDADAFARAHARFAKARSVDRYYKKYFEYGRLMDSVLRRDAEFAQRTLQELDALFRARTTDKWLVQLPLLAASGDDNDLVVDIWAVALARFARHRGVCIDFSSDVMPLGPFR